MSTDVLWPAATEAAWPCAAQTAELEEEAAVADDAFDNTDEEEPTSSAAKMGHQATEQEEEEPQEETDRSGKEWPEWAEVASGKNRPESHEVARSETREEKKRSGMTSAEPPLHPMPLREVPQPGSAEAIRQSAAAEPQIQAAILNTREQLKDEIAEIEADKAKKKAAADARKAASSRSPGLPAGPPEAQAAFNNYLSMIHRIPPPKGPPPSSRPDEENEAGNTPRAARSEARSRSQSTHTNRSRSTCSRAYSEPGDYWEPSEYEDEDEEGDFGSAVADGSAIAEPRRIKRSQINKQRLEDWLRIYAFQGEREERGRRPSAKQNEEPEAGNFGIYQANFGTRPSDHGGKRMTAKKKRERLERQANMDTQITKNPCQVVILQEATAAVAKMLEEPSVGEDPTAVGTKLDKRTQREHFVVRAPEQTEKDPPTVLIAARREFCKNLETLEWWLNPDHTYTETKKNKTTGERVSVTKMARSRCLICTITFKQGMGFIGQQLVVANVHLHRDTANLKWPDALKKWIQGLADRIKRYNVQILSGDFNMSLTKMRAMLWEHDIKCDCIAWYPWIHKEETTLGSALGLDSCAVFWIGGDIEARMPWRHKDIPLLTAVAEGSKQWDTPEHELQIYPKQGGCVPGQPWRCYFTKKERDDPDFKLSERLEGLLKPSTSKDELDRKFPYRNNHVCPHMKTKQKSTSGFYEEWLVNVDGEDEYDNDAHFPLAVYFQNTKCLRSQEAQDRRDNKHWYRKQAHRWQQHVPLPRWSSRCFEDADQEEKWQKGQPAYAAVAERREDEWQPAKVAIERGRQEPRRIEVDDAEQDYNLFPYKHQPWERSSQSQSSQQAQSSHQEPRWIEASETLKHDVSQGKWRVGDEAEWRERTAVADWRQSSTAYCGDEWHWSTSHCDSGGYDTRGGYDSHVRYAETRWAQKGSGCEGYCDVDERPRKVWQKPCYRKPIGDEDEQESCGWW